MSEGTQPHPGCGALCLIRRREVRRLRPSLLAQYRASVLRGAPIRCSVVPLLSKLRNEKGPQSEGGRQIADFVGEPCLQCIRQNALARTRPLTFGKPNKIHTLDAVSLFTVNGFSHEVKKHNLTAKADPNVGVFNLCSRQTGLSQQRIDVSALFLRTCKCEPGHYTLGTRNYV